MPRPISTCSLLQSYLVATEDNAATFRISPPEVPTQLSPPKQNALLMQRHPRRASRLPRLLPLRLARPAQARRLPAPPPSRHPPDAVPAAVQVVRALPARLAGHAQAVPGQQAHQREPGDRGGREREELSAV